MMRHGIVPSDIVNLMEEQNVEASVGSIGEDSRNTFQYTLRYSGRKQDVTEFENLVLTSKTSGETLLLKDVATLELGQSDYSYVNSINGHPGVMGSVSQVAGSNATRINLEIDKLLTKVEQNLPKDVRIVTFDNTNDFLFAAIREVVFTLILAILLVLVVVYLFVQDFRATLIPALGIVVSLIGTFAFMAVAGFSINLLTLFALVLVIGTVVDDSIVVVEAVQARFDAGYNNPHKAAVDAMNGLTAALFTTTLVFMVIFIPVSFISGTTGIFYKQFGLTMAVAVGISLLVALTLAPALCALILRPATDDASFSSRVRNAYKTAFNAVMGKYAKLAMAIIKRKWVAGVSIAAALVLMVVLMRVVPTGFVPDEDMGSLYADISTPPGYTLASTEQILERASDRIQEIPEVESVGAVAGFGGANNGMIQVQLKPWKQRRGKDHSSWSVTERINEILAMETDAESMAMSPGMIDGYGGGNSIELSVLNHSGADIRTFFEVSERFIEALNQRPEIEDIYSSYAIDYPQYRLDVDAARCKKMGVSPASVLNELSAFLGSSYASNFNRFNQIYQVTLQLRPDDRSSLQSLDRLYVRSDAGVMLPVSQFITLTKEYMPQSLNNFNMISSIDIYGSAASSTGDAIKAIREIATTELPVGYSVEFGGITREESQTGSNVAMIFLICIVFVYLIMVALYESLFIPLAVMLGVPFGLAGAFLFAKLFGVENNIYLQVGLLMLIGLLGKTAILLTEYATQCREAGMTLKQSAFFAARMRLRPILMTSLTMIFGMLPLMFASGAGANGSRTIGVGTIGGMLFGTLGLLLVVPTLFVVFQTLQERFKPLVVKPSDDPMIQEELKRIEEYHKRKELGHE